MPHNRPHNTHRCRCDAVVRHNSERDGDRGGLGQWGAGDGVQARRHGWQGRQQVRKGRCGGRKQVQQVQQSQSLSLHEHREVALARATDNGVQRHTTNEQASQPRPVSPAVDESEQEQSGRQVQRGIQTQVCMHAIAARDAHLDRYVSCTRSSPSAYSASSRMKDFLGVDVRSTWCSRMSRTEAGVGRWCRFSEMHPLVSTEVDAADIKSRATAG
jgi:hypothetical protein